MFIFVCMAFLFGRIINIIKLLSRFLSSLADSRGGWRELLEVWNVSKSAVGSGRSERDHGEGHVVRGTF